MQNSRMSTWKLGPRLVTKTLPARALPARAPVPAEPAQAAVPAELAQAAVPTARRPGGERGAGATWTRAVSAFGETPPAYSRDR